MLFSRIAAIIMASFITHSSMLSASTVFGLLCRSHTLRQRNLLARFFLITRGILLCRRVNTIWRHFLTIFLITSKMLFCRAGAAVIPRPFLTRFLLITRQMFRAAQVIRRVKITSKILFWRLLPPALGDVETCVDVEGFTLLPIAVDFAVANGAWPGEVEDGGFCLLRSVTSRLVWTSRDLHFFQSSWTLLSPTADGPEKSRIRGVSTTVSTSSIRCLSPTVASS